MKDYSQHGEGLFLSNLIKDNKGIFVDIGAHDGITNSNSNIFAQRGWKIIYFEPNPVTYSRLVRNTENFDRELYNIAISDKFDFSNFEIVRRVNYEGHSKLTDKGTHKVITMPLSSFSIKNIDILSIDAEGHDTIILQSILESGIRPKYIIIEANNSEELIKQKNILEKEYSLIKHIKVNTIWKINS